jgi:urease accessory protein
MGLAFCFAAPVLAHAPTGVGGTSGLAEGAVHPLAGWDHLLAMLTVGLWAGQRGGRAVWLVPLAFIAVMAMGGALAVGGISLPWVEPGVAASVLVLGTLVAAAVRLPVAASAALVAAFALVHGHAHGAELPATASGLAYAVGFMATTAGLHLCGVAAATFWQRTGAAATVRIAGGAMAACGLYLCLA